MKQKSKIIFLSFLLFALIFTVFGYNVVTAEPTIEYIVPGVETLIWPLDGTNGKYVTSDYGSRDLSGDGTCDDYHNGWDMDGVYTKDGDPVVAAYAGVVTIADDYDNSSEGKWIKIDHSNYADEMIEDSIYLHLSRVDVEVGDYVSAGKIIGGVGNTGASFGTHLHFGVYDVNGNTYSPGTHPFENKSGIDVTPYNISEPCSQ